MRIVFISTPGEGEDSYKKDMGHLLGVKSGSRLSGFLASKGPQQELSRYSLVYWAKKQARISIFKSRP